MQHKELRLGVVLTGGVSLVVYLHGVSKELLKLVRASRAYHTRTDADDQHGGTYSDSCNGREVDTEQIYFDLLRAIGAHVDLRVMIDVIAGASAGGVNGIVLARALANDLDIDSHRQMWLRHADAIRLLDEQTGPWSKMALRPVLRWLLQGRLSSIAPEPETREKLAAFIRSRWFQPPFSGSRYANWLLEAFDAMDRHAPPEGSLLPEGHPLDLFVSVTDFHGHTNHIPLHSPPEIAERDHGHVLHFRDANAAAGEARSDFGPDDVPGLVFAARATSCFPGAFPPAQISEIDDVLSRKDRVWRSRDDFVEQRLGGFLTDGRKIEDVFLIDGSVVNNKPFGSAIAAITGRPAYRAVSRRVLFIEPSPADQADVEAKGAPGFFRTIFAALAEIPRNEPVHDDLTRVHEFNRETTLIRQVVEQVQPQIDPFVDAILPPPDAELKPTAAKIAEWRDAANSRAADQAGYAFQSYFRLKLLRVAERLGGLATTLTASGAASASPTPAEDWLAAVLERLGVRGCNRSDDTAARVREIDFLKSFDVDFRIRRLRFVIRRLNQLYALARRHPDVEDQTERLDELKTTLYGLIESAQHRWQREFYADDVVDKLRAELAGAVHGEPDAEPVLNLLSEAMGLVRFDEAIDEVFAVMVLNYIPAGLRRDLFSAYLGFSFFDVMIFPMAQHEEFAELEEILIDRISPADAVAIRSDKGAQTLRGTAMRKFAGFFNRAYRENDYLWGRLNAADRLVDILLGAAEETETSLDIDATEFKHRLFTAILNAEESFLTADPNLIPSLRDEVAAMKSRTA